MKKWIILVMALAVCSLCIQAQPTASFLTKKISLKAENTTIRELLKTIEEKAGFTFSYSDDVVPLNRKEEMSCH